MDYDHTKHVVDNTKPNDNAKTTDGKQEEGKPKESFIMWQKE